MRLLISFAVLVVLGTSFTAFAWIYRKRLLVFFGIHLQQPPVDDLESQEGQGKAAAPTRIGLSASQDASNYAKGGGRQLNRQGSGAESGTGSAGTSSAGKMASDGAAPMIVVAENATNRGAVLPYDVLEAACEHWADSRCIGSGGAARVYRAELPRYGAIAVKRFHVKDGSSKLWTRELEALCQCRHPHILEIIGHADEGPENLIVMPLMEGGTLFEAMPKMWWATRVVNMGQVVRALSFLHGKGILHRDVKSSNILVDASLRYTRLSDFGLAKDQVARAAQQTSHGTTGVVMGSPGYMAPELMMRPATEKTDAYAVGVVLFEILTGLPAWDTDQNGVVLTDRAVVDGKFLENLVDAVGRWPSNESAACSAQAIGLTLFDPSLRKTLAALEQDDNYVEHLERARTADVERYSGLALGSLASPR